MLVTTGYVIFISPLFAALCEAICYHCFSSDAALEPKVRTHLGTQEDIFFMPLTSRTSSCSVVHCAITQETANLKKMSEPKLTVEHGIVISDKIDADYPAIESQICSSSPLCVTLTPNIENSTFVVRGCMEYILRHSLKKEDIHKEGCYLVRSLPARFPNNFTVEYILCVCNGDYCNGEQPPDFLPGPHSFHGKLVLRLNEKDDDALLAPGQRIQLEVSSTTMPLVTVPLFHCLLYTVYLYL